MGNSACPFLLFANLWNQAEKLLRMFQLVIVQTLRMSIMDEIKCKIDIEDLVSAAGISATKCESGKWRGRFE